MGDRNKFKKVLVRNTRLPPPKVTILKANDPQVKGQNLDSPSESKNGKSEEKKEATASMDKPELYTLLKLDKKLDEIVKLRPKKEKVENKLAVDEQITRKMNFPYDQPIYKDLIPLTSTQVQPVICSRGPLPLKDREPVLSDFLVSKEVPDYYCLPNVELKKTGMLINTNNLKLYHIYRDV